MAIEKAQNNLLGNFPMNSVSNQLSKFTTSLKTWSFLIRARFAEVSMLNPAK